MPKMDMNFGGNSANQQSNNNNSSAVNFSDFQFFDNNNMDHQSQNKANNSGSKKYF